MEEIWRVGLEELWPALIWKPTLHFVSSGCVGLLVYYLTSTMLQRSLSGDTGTHRLMRGAFSICSFSLLLALSFSVWVHIVEDYTLGWF